jgi:hypothetical protein
MSRRLAWPQPSVSDERSDAGNSQDGQRVEADVRDDRLNACADVIRQQSDDDRPDDATKSVPPEGMEASRSSDRDFGAPSSAVTRHDQDPHRGTPARLTRRDENCRRAQPADGPESIIAADAAFADWTYGPWHANST